MVYFLLSEDRIRNGIKKILKARNTGTQVRLDSFFKVTSTTPSKRKVNILLSFKFKFSYLSLIFFTARRD